MVRRYVVYDIPDEMAACFGCEAIRCPDAKYRTCPRRLALLAEMHPPEAATADAAGPAMFMAAE
jgi:hypothetical protein